MPIPQHSLVIVAGPQQGRRIPIQGQLSIGRNPDSGLQLDDLQVSRRHAVIQQTPTGLVVRDLGSGNGTFIGDRRILEYRLANGDVIRIGQTVLRYEMAGTPVPTASSAPQEILSSGVRFRADIQGTLEASSVENVHETFFRAPDAAVTAEQLRTAQQRLAAVYKANQLFSSERDLKKLFARVMDQIFSLTPAHNGVILLKNDSSPELQTEYVNSKTQGSEVIISSTIVNRAARLNEAILTLNAADDSRFESGMSIITQNISSAMCVPLTHLGETLGVIYVDTRGTTSAFTQSDLELLVALSGGAAIAIKNAQFVALLERSYQETLIVMANAVEMRDHYTVGHTWRVTNFALQMAVKMGWDEERLRQVQTGGVLHDVGKIAVDNAILSKPSRLTDEEYEKMKVHPERGARMMMDVVRLKPIIPYCLYHHERYDGRGYPYGLKGEDIPIEGRLIAVADTFDAMTSHRPYRRGLNPEIAIEEIEKGKGTQFDPVCADALIFCYREGKVDRVFQDYMKSEKSIACPFCSTYISIPEGASEDDVFECQVCHRRVRLKVQNQAYYGELLAETEASPSVKA